MGRTIWLLLCKEVMPGRHGGGARPFYSGAVRTKYVRDYEPGGLKGGESSIHVFTWKLRRNEPKVTSI